MTCETKPTVSKEETFDKLEIRVGRIVSVEIAADAPKPAYVIKADFGKYGIRTEFLCLGVQYPKADSGEATIFTPLVEAKIAVSCSEPSHKSTKQ